MKKLLVVALVLGTMYAGTVAPAGAVPPGKKFVFPVSEAVPCSIGFTVDICAYNLPASALGFRACENPFPPGSFVDVLTDPAPSPPAGRKMILQLDSFPQVDWDSWICARLSNGSNNGGELAQGANVLGENCDNFLGPDNPVPVGCIEQAQAPAEAGKRYVLRAYNYFDAADNPALYQWIFV